MGFDDAVRMTEIMLAVAFTMQNLEHIAADRRAWPIVIPRTIFSVLLLWGIQSPWACLGLLMIGLILLHRHQGPYNGGSDRMGLLILTCLCLVQFLPQPFPKEALFGYLAIQLLLSYLMSGWVKIINPDWRTGQALSDVFRFSTYPVSDDLRRWAERPKILLIMSWAVILFELGFPLTLIDPTILTAGLAIAAAFHLANARLFGLNRFFWVWISAFPSILWLQMRLF